jgi:hypothetical protein
LFLEDHLFSSTGLECRQDKPLLAAGKDIVRGGREGKVGFLWVIVDRCPAAEPGMLPPS